jgi:DNA-binding CsgD family transcriptional regulator
MLRMKYEGTDLTMSEVRVLRLLARGLTLGEAAGELGISRETARSQVKVARARLGARNQAHAIAIAVSAELI